MPALVPVVYLRLRASSQRLREAGVSPDFLPARRLATLISLVEIWPVNTVSRADQAPIRALSRGSVLQPREPSQRHSDRASVGQVDRQGILAYCNLLGQNVRLNLQ